MRIAPSRAARRPSSGVALAAGVALSYALPACMPIVDGLDVSGADCSVDGACADPTCTEPDRYRVDEEVAFDLAHGRRLWQRGDALNLDYAQAVAHCASLELDGITGWRLPDGAESGSIVLRAGGLKGCGAPGYCTPAIDQAVFPGTAADLYWTSQAYMPAMHLSRSFCDGRSTPYADDDAALHHVRCVHDPAPVAPSPPL